MVKKIPPPPTLAIQDQALNRWLLELTSFLNASGGIDTGAIPGLDTLQAQVNDNTQNITELTNTAQQHSIDINTLLGLTTNMQSEISGLSQVLNGTVDPDPALGKVNDWYANTAGAAGHRVFIKTAPTVWTAFPF